MDPDRNFTDTSQHDKTGCDHENGQALNKDDPIYLRLPNRPSAQLLIEGYFKHFEYRYLDPELYTFDFIREASSFLFTTLLSIASRAFQPDLYPAVRQHAENLMGRVLLSCDATIGNIWAIICIYYWKELGDKRGYTFLVGFAMRLAESLGWKGAHWERRAKDTCQIQLAERQVRQRRDQERIWLYLRSIDRTSVALFTLLRSVAKCYVGYPCSQIAPSQPCRICRIC